MTKIYLDELEDVSSELISYSENNIANKILELKQSPSNFIWQGPAYNSFIAGYNSKINELTKMNNSLTNLAKYLTNVKESYSDTNSKINNAYEELLSEFERIGK